jgi:hypothetical protein
MQMVAGTGQSIFPDCWGPSAFHSSRAGQTRQPLCRFLLVGDRDCFYPPADYTERGFLFPHDFPRTLAVPATVANRANNITSPCI